MKVPNPANGIGQGGKMKKAFLTGALLISVAALMPIAAYCNEGDVPVSGTAVQGSVPDYSSWVMVNQAWMPVPVSGLEFPMSLLVARGIFSEDPNNEDARWVALFWVLGNQVVRKFSGKDNFQILINGVWRDCATAAEPKVFLITGLKQWYWPFGGTEVKGVRLEMPSDDGVTVLRLEVVPVAGKK